MRVALILVVLLFSSASIVAAYNANMRGTLARVIVYADGDYIYVSLVNQPASHPQCDPTYFVVPGTVSFDRRQMLLSRLMMAYASEDEVNIGYDSLGDCANGYIRVHAVG